MGVNISYDLTYEIDGDGDLGAIQSVDVSGHIDFADEDIVLATLDAEGEFYYSDAPIYFEVERLWRSEHPVADFEEMARWEYHYTAEQREAAVPVTRFQIASYWGHLCVNHPDELASTGIPASQIVEDQQHLAVKGYVYLCQPCAQRFTERQAAARRAALSQGASA